MENFVGDVWQAAAYGKTDRLKRTVTPGITAGSKPSKKGKKGKKGIKGLKGKKVKAVAQQAEAQHGPMAAGLT